MQLKKIMYIDLVDPLPKVTHQKKKRVRKSIDQLIAKCVTTAKSLLGSNSAIMNLSCKNKDPSSNEWNSNNQFKSIF